MRLMLSSAFRSPAWACAALVGAAATLSPAKHAAAQEGSAPPAVGAWAAVDTVLGRRGASQAGGVVRYSFPRSDLRVSVDGVAIRPALALGSWVAFRNVGGGHVMAMGDLVLAEHEVNGVIDALQSGGVEQSALHNHLLAETPSTMYLHIAAHGDAAAIARTVRAALQRTGTPLDTAGPGAPPPLALDTAAVTAALGHGGKATGGVWQVSVPRRETIREGRRVVPPAMGLGTALNFQPTENGRAAITGDFVMTGTEVNHVIRALRAHGIGITALHSHMIGEAPRLYFMHFWAHDDAVKLARGLRAALDETNSAAPRGTQRR